MNAQRQRMMASTNDAQRSEDVASCKTWETDGSDQRCGADTTHKEKRTAGRNFPWIRRDRVRGVRRGAQARNFGSWSRPPSVRTSFLEPGAPADASRRPAPSL